MQGRRCLHVTASQTNQKLLDTLREAKEKSKATYDEMAVYAGCNADMIKNIFAGKISCSNFLIICAIFKKTGISLDEFAEIPLRVDTRSHVDTLAFASTLNALQAQDARTDSAHLETISLLQNTIGEYRAALTETRERNANREKKLHAKNVLLCVIAYALLAVIMLFVVIDFLSPTVGWWRANMTDAVRMTAGIRIG